RCFQWYQAAFRWLLILKGNVRLLKFSPCRLVICPATLLVDGRTLLVLRFLGRGKARAHQYCELELQFSRLDPGPVEGRRPVRRCGSESSPISTAGPWLRMALRRVGAVRPQSS